MVFLFFFVAVSSAAVVRLGQWVARPPKISISYRDLHTLVQGSLFLSGLHPEDIIHKDFWEREGPDGLWSHYRTEILVADNFPLMSWLEKLRASLDRAGASLDYHQATGGMLVEVRSPSRFVEGLLVKRRSRSVETASRDAAVRKMASIVVDDLGQHLAPFHQLTDLGIPLTFSILPRLEHSRTISREALRLNLETLLHLPMEPLDPEKYPGPGALLSSMSATELRAQLRADLESLPEVVGVNNHMGSRITANSGAMEVVMDELQSRGLFFLDSLTTPRSLAFETARRKNLPAAKRDLFLDARDDPRFIRSQLQKLVQLAKKRGAAIGIGHAYPNTIAVLQEMRLELLDSGVEWVPVSELVQANPSPREEF